VQRWEYLVAMSDVAGHGGERVRIVNHRELPDWESGPRVVDQLNQFGAEGWELVSHLEATRPDGMMIGGRYIFKRPAQ
jgi:hypothetical protein